MKKIYVVGFAFSPGLNAVALIRKTNATDSNGEQRPGWLQNKYNGVGTDLTENQANQVINAGGTIGVYSKCMVDTFSTRTGCLTDPYAWRPFHTIKNDGATVVFFCTTLSAMQWQQVRTMTKEEVRKVNVNTLFDPAGNVSGNVVSNLKWLIPMATDVSHVYSTSADINGMSTNDIASHAYTEFMKQTAVHMQPANLIPADKLADTPTTDALLVNIANAHDIVANMGNGTDLMDALLHLAQLQYSGSLYLKAIAEVYGVDTTIVMRVAKVGSDALEQYPIDIATGIDATKKAIATLYAKSVLAGEGTTSVPGKETTGEGVDNSSAKGTDTTGAEKNTGGAENIILDNNAATIDMVHVTSWGSGVVETVPALPPAAEIKTDQEDAANKNIKASAK